MECTIYNPQKSRLETLDVEITAENTTRFSNRGNGSVTMITDWEGGLLIKSGFNYPIWFYDVTRADIGYSQKRPNEFMRQHRLI